MKQILLIGSTTAIDAEAGMLKVFQAEFRLALKKARISSKVFVCAYDEIGITLGVQNFSVYDHHNGRSLETYDLVIFKGAIVRSYIPQAISKYLHEKDIPFFSDYSQFRSLNKLTQLVDMHQLGLPFPKTLYLENPKRLLEEVQRNWKFPLVVKGARGSRGRDNFLVSSAIELGCILRKRPRVRFLVEEYVAGEDFRILVIGNSTKVLLRQQRSDMYLRNTSQGAGITTVTEQALPGKIIKESKLLARKMRMTIAGVDVIYDKDSNTYYFLEINSQPAIGQPETVHLLKHLLTKKLS